MLGEAGLCSRPVPTLLVVLLAVRGGGRRTQVVLEEQVSLFVNMTGGGTLRRSPCPHSAHLPPLFLLPATLDRSSGGSMHGGSGLWALGSGL